MGNGNIVRCLKEELSLPAKKDKSEVALVKDVPFLGLQIIWEG